MTEATTVSDVVRASRPRSHRSGGRRQVFWLGWLGVALLLIMILAAVFAPLITSSDPDFIGDLPHLGPSGDHWLGTNDLGQDIFTRLIYGSRLSLSIGVLAGLLASGVGIVAGLAAGYYKGVTEMVIMRAVDLTLSLPFIPLVIVLVAFFGRGLWITVVAIAVLLWARPARIVRSQVLKVSAFQHVDASRAMGSTSLRTIYRHVLPRTWPLAVAQFVYAANIAILIEASLAFLGLGDPERVSWGTMLFFANSANAMLTQAWQWWVLPPGLALTASVVGFAFVGVALEQWGDRRLSESPSASVSTRRSKRPVARELSAGSSIDTKGSALSVRDLRVVYNALEGDLYAVDGVNFDIGERKIVGLVGESGCGKTTLAMSLVGLIPAPGVVVGGSILVAGRDLAAATPRELETIRGRSISLIPQSSMNALNPAYTVHRQLTETAELTMPKKQALDRADEMFDLVGLAASHHRSFPHQLSGGMRQRVVIAMAVINNPQLLIADEPLTGLDVLTQERIVDLFLKLREHLGVAILLVSHDLPLVGQVSDELLVMYAGQIIESGAANDVISNPAHPYTQELLKAFPTLYGPRGDLTTLPGQPPDLRMPPSGCRFHPRCPQTIEVCATKVPEQTTMADNHKARCLLLQ